MTASTVLQTRPEVNDGLREQVWAALSTVRDPELDESITDLTFVSDVDVNGGDVAVSLRLPTFFCAPNFAYLMVADAYDAVAAIPGVTSARIELLDHFASAEINAGVSERAGFSNAFAGQADDDLSELRVTFQRKAYLASLERACKVLLDRGWEVAELYAAQLFDLPSGAERTSLWRRRDDLGMSCLPHAYLMFDEHGTRIPQADVPLKLRFAKAVRVSIDGNGTMCRGLLKVRYGTDGEPGTMSGVTEHHPVDLTLEKADPVKAVQLAAYGSTPVLHDVPDPQLKGPLDVIVRIGGAGVCRTDLHVIEGQWEQKSGVALPYTIGHENAGWVEAVGDAVSHVKVGDPVILHPLATCGLCRYCRAGDDVHCENSKFPGIDSDGGYAEYLLTNARAVVKLDASLQPADVAALADAGLTAYHAAAKVARQVRPGDKVVVIGAGGLGHIGVQVLLALSAAEIIVVDRSVEALAVIKEMGVNHTVLGDGTQVQQVLDLTGGKGAEAVVDFVGEGGAIEDGVAMLRRAGSYYVIGYGGELKIPTIDIISTEINFVGNLVGSYNDLVELMVLAAAGKVKLHTQKYALTDFATALDDLDHGKVRGRAILVP